MLSILLLTYTIFGSYLTLIVVPVILEYMEASKIQVGYLNLFLGSIVLPFLLPIARLYGLLKGRSVKKSTGVK